MATFWNALRDRAFWAIVAGLVAGFLGGSPWVFIPLLGVLLTLFSTISDQQWLIRFREVGRLDALAYFWLEAFALNCVFVGLAFVLGAGLR